MAEGLVGSVGTARGLAPLSRVTSGTFFTRNCLLDKDPAPRPAERAPALRVRKHERFRGPQGTGQGSALGSILGWTRGFLGAGGKRTVTFRPTLPTAGRLQAPGGREATDLPSSRGLALLGSGLSGLGQGEAGTFLAFMTLQKKDKSKS